MVLACTTLLYKYLPLLDDCFNDGLKDLLGVPDALFVTAEAIPRVEDGNRPGQFRVDFFAYMKSGDVHRYHPGSSPSQSATPHVMRMDSNLFQVDCATATGVGRALHLVAPGFASASSRGNGNDVAAFTLAHLQEVSIYDRQRNAGWRLLQQAVTRMATKIPPGTNELDVTGGELFPWWLSVANCGHASAIVDDGIFEVKVAFHDNQKPVLIVRNTSGTYRVKFNKSICMERM